MARKPTLKQGVLTQKEKVYIAEHFLDPSRNVEWIAKQLKRTVEAVQKYIDKISFKQTPNVEVAEEVPAEVQEVKKTKEPKLYAEHQGGATQLSPEALSKDSSPIKTKSKRYVSPYRTR